MDVIELEERQREKRCEILIQNIKEGDFNNLKEAEELAKLYGRRRELKESIKKGKKSKFEYLLNRIREGNVSESDKIKTKGLAEEYNEIKRFNEAKIIGEQKIRNQKEEDIKKLNNFFDKIRESNFKNFEYASTLSAKYGKMEELSKALKDGFDNLKDMGYKFECPHSLNTIKMDILMNLNKIKEIRDAVKKTTYGIIEVPNGKEQEFFKSCGINGIDKKQFVNKINTTNRVDGLQIKAKLNNGNIKVMTW